MSTRTVGGDPAARGMTTAGRELPEGFTADMNGQSDRYACCNVTSSVFLAVRYALLDA